MHTYVIDSKLLHSDTRHHLSPQQGKDGPRAQFLKLLIFIVLTMDVESRKKPRVDGEEDRESLVKRYGYDNNTLRWCRWRR